MADKTQTQKSENLEGRLKAFENTFSVYQNLKGTRNAFYSNPTDPEVLKRIVDQFDNHRTGLGRSQAENQVIIDRNTKIAEKTMKNAMDPEVYKAFKKKYFASLPDKLKLHTYLALAGKYTPKKGISKELGEVIQAYNKADKLMEIASVVKENTGKQKEEATFALKEIWSQEIQIEDKELEELMKLSAQMYADRDNANALANLTIAQAKLQIGEAMEKYQQIKDDDKYRKLTRAVDNEIASQNAYAEVAEQLYGAYVTNKRAEEQEKKAKEAEATAKKATKKKAKG